MINILRIYEAKHATELISFEIQCFDSTFVDKLFKSVFKSLRFEKHASKCYFKITTYLSAFLDKIMIKSDVNWFQDNIFKSCSFI